jgi:hypothetical protein
MMMVMIIINHFKPEVVGNIFLRNVGNHLKECTASPPRRPHWTTMMIIMMMITATTVI